MPSPNCADLLSRVRDYTKAHPELEAAHHFLFDLPLVAESHGADVIVFGINPGETAEDLDKQLSRREESREYDFQEVHGRAKSSRRWLSTTRDFVGESTVVFTEILFWSSPDVRALRQRYGELNAQNKHIQFCAGLNKELIARYRPNLIVCPGLVIERFAELYGLRLETKNLFGGKRRVASLYRDADNRPWLFTLHWSGARISKTDRELIRKQISLLQSAN